MTKMMLFILLLSSTLEAETLAPQLLPLTHEEIGVWVGKVNVNTTIDKTIILRGLISDQMTLRADCARYLATHGSLSDVPYLIDKLSDDSYHIGANYPYAGMATTRYWANIALISITKVNFGYVWNDPIEKREQAIKYWANYWAGIKYRINK